MMQIKRLVAGLRTVATRRDVDGHRPAGHVQGTDELRSLINMPMTEPTALNLVPMVVEQTARGERAYDIY